MYRQQALFHKEMTGVLRALGALSLPTSSIDPSTPRALACTGSAAGKHQFCGKTSGISNTYERALHPQYLTLDNHLFPVQQVCRPEEFDKAMISTVR